VVAAMVQGHDHKPGWKAETMSEISAKAQLDSAITDYLRATGDDGAILTGWVLSGSVKHPSAPGSDGYFVEHSAGLPFHSQLGLLMAGLDEKRNRVLINTLNSEEG
jgi:hypothetical protein